MEALVETWHVACPLPGLGYIPNKPKTHKQTVQRGSEVSSLMKGCEVSSIIMVQLQVFSSTCNRTHP